MAKAEVGARIQMGWILAGRQSVNLKSQGIVTAGEAMASNTGLVDMDVWVLPEAMIPQGMVTQALYDLAKQEMGDVSTLNTISTALLRLGIADLVERMDAQILAANQAQNNENLPGSGPKEDNPPDGA
jgi:hypothetical protein